jgi:hypothetical protein
MKSPEKSLTSSLMKKKQNVPYNTSHVSGKVGSIIMILRCFFFYELALFSQKSPDLRDFRYFSPCNDIAHIAHFWNARMGLLESMGDKRKYTFK